MLLREYEFPHDISCIHAFCVLFCSGSQPQHGGQGLAGVLLAATAYFVLLMDWGVFSVLTCSFDTGRLLGLTIPCTAVAGVMHVVKALEQGGAGTGR